MSLLKETGMLGYKQAETPIAPKIKFGAQGESHPIHKGQISRPVRKLIYLPHARPDIGFLVSVMS